MTDIQTEARAIVTEALPPHEQAILGHDAVTVLTDLIATALAAKDAELARLEHVVAYESGEPDALKYHKALFARLDRAEAQLAEANKARNYLKDAVTVGLSDSEISRRAKLFIAACEAQGGE